MLGRLRAWAMLITWGAGLGLVGPFAIPLTALTRREEFITVPAAIIARFGMWLGGVKVTIHGRERINPDGVYVFTPNHQSLLDPPIVWVNVGTWHRRAGLLVKKEIKKVPVLGVGIDYVGMLAVDRSNPEAARESARRASAAIKAGRSFFVFSEGTRTRDGNLLPFKKGAFYMAIDAGVPVVPVTIDGAFAAMPRGAIRLRPVPITVTFHEPIPTAGMTEADVPALLERARDAVASALTL